MNLVTYMNIAFFETTPDAKAYMKKAFPKDKLLFFEESFEAKHIAKVKDCEVISVFIHSTVSKDLVEMLPKLKLISTRSTGFDHIDVAYCKSKGIHVCNVPFYGENTVAEHTFALILALSRKIHQSYVRTTHHDYSIEGLEGFDLKDKTIGIIGGGHIGMHVARMAKGFEMHVRVFDVRPNSFLASVLGFRYLPLDEILKEADVISLHVPYNKFTHHLVNKKNIKTMKKGAIIINTSRGGVIDTEALYEALSSGHLAGAGLDVIEGEEYITEEREIFHKKGHYKAWKQVVQGHKLFKMENVLFTPHNAFNSKEANERILEKSVEGIKSLKGKEIANSVII
ncbi:hydroxyacid dehydrogenase [Candidatus Woesearchaeota archaeon]|nr:hydroxyacid dehydrogenase [Candidatus Woesearchaeota archaeon]